MMKVLRGLFFLTFSGSILLALIILLLVFAKSFIHGVSEMMVAIGFFNSLFIVSLFTCILLSKKNRSWVWIWNVGVAFLLLGVFDKIMGFDQNKVRLEVENNERIDKVDDILGYKPLPNKQLDVSELKGDTLLFDVTYTIDENSHRVTPFFQPAKDSASIIFFGCSYTFGWGLEDDQTIPYRVGKKLNNEMKIYNFAFPGYGTHQMVSALQNHLVDSVVKIPPKQVIYIFSKDHLRRIVNQKDSGTHDPEYYLDEKGNLKYAGHFDDSPLVKEVKTNLKTSTVESFLLKNLVEVWQGSISDHHVFLFSEMVEYSRDEIKKKYPDCRFDVILWEEGEDELYTQIKKELEERNINFTSVLNIIPNFKKEEVYIKYPYEKNPNARSAGIISDFIAEKWMQDRKALSRMSLNITETSSAE